MSETFSDRIKRLCKEVGITTAELERRIGVSKGYILNISKSNSSPSYDKMAKIAKTLNVPVDVVLGKEMKPEVFQSSNGVLIPLVGRVAAGVPIAAVENIIGKEEISRALAETGDFFALKIRGDSMQPFIMDGDVVVVRKQDDADTGDIVIAIVNGDDGCCKRLKKTAHGITLISLNTAYDPMVFDHSEIDTIPVRIAGKVIEIRREL